MAAPPPLRPASTPPLAYAQPAYPPAGHRPADIGQDAGMRLLLPVGRSGWAIAAGYAGLFAFVVLPAPLAVVLGIVAIIDIRRHPDRHGMGRAIFGLVAGILGSAVLLMGLIAVAAGRH